jgi:hypothetical protein
MTETIEEQRKVEGFGDPQYTCSDTELTLRRTIYKFFQRMDASGQIYKMAMTQDWQGNTLHIEGSFRPAQLAHDLTAALEQAHQHAHRAVTLPATPPEQSGPAQID